MFAKLVGSGLFLFFASASAKAGKAELKSMVECREAKWNLWAIKTHGIFF